MPETSRECVVCLLDDSCFTVPVQSTLLGSELLDMAASHLNIKEKEYFGLFTEGDGFKNWLELDKPVLDPSQDLPKGSQSIKIHFSFKYYVDDLRLLSDYMTVDLLYLQSRQAVMKGDISSDDDTIFELAACAMQSQFGEMRSEQDARHHLKSFPIIPPHVFKRVAVSQCEERILQYYRMLHNVSRGEAIFKYLEIIQSLPMYSMHYFEVKDKKDVHMWLGVGPEGICQCPSNNRNEPECRFQWLQLQNIYYRDRKFSMEVYQSNKPSKKGVGFGPVVVYAWHGANSKIVMAIWKMARDQHVFYRSKRTNRNPHLGMNQTEITRQLNKLHRTNISPSSSQSSLSMESAKSNQTQASAEAVAAAKAAQSEMYSALLARRQNLMAEFEKKAARYKDILVKEMQITGIPPEGLTAEEIEKMRKKFGVSFKFSKFVLDDNMGTGDEVEQLEKQLEIQSSIIEASKTLLGQANNRKSKKDRRKEIKKMEDKYSDLEQRLSDLKRTSRGSTMSGGTRFYGDSPGSVPVSRRRSGTPGGASIDDNFLASMIFDTPPKPTSSGGLQKSPHHKSTSALSDIQTAPTSSKNHTPSNVSGKAHTLAVTESSSYLSSIGGYSDGFEDLSPSSSIASGNTSFVSNIVPPQYNRVGSYPTGVSKGGGGNNIGGGNMDIADEIFKQFGGVHSSSPTGSYSSPRKLDHAHHVDIPASLSPVTRYKRASSPTIGFPTESRQRFVVSHEGNPHHHHHHGRMPHPQDVRRSHSPDVVVQEHYPSSYHGPNMMNQAAAAAYHRAQHSKPAAQQQQHRHQRGGASPGNVSPTPHRKQQHVSGGVGVSPANLSPTTHRKQVLSPGNHSPTHQRNQRRGVSPNASPTPHRHQQQFALPGRAESHAHHGEHHAHLSERQQEMDSRQMRYSGGVSPGTIATPTTHGRNQQQPQPSHSPVPTPAVPVSNSGTEPVAMRGPRKASDQEMGLLEVLNMWDKSKENPFGDGTLV